MTRTERIAALKAAAKERVLVLDGSWGVMIQKRGLAEADYRGERFQDHPGQLKGDNDLLCITRPSTAWKRRCATSTSRAPASAARSPTAGPPRSRGSRASSPAPSARCR